MEDRDLDFSIWWTNNDVEYSVIGLLDETKKSILEKLGEKKGICECELLDAHEDDIVREYSCIIKDKDGVVIKKASIKSKQEGTLMNYVFFEK